MGQIALVRSIEFHWCQSDNKCRMFHRQADPAGLNATEGSTPQVIVSVHPIHARQRARGWVGGDPKERKHQWEGDIDWSGIKKVRSVRLLLTT